MNKINEAKMGFTLMEIIVVMLIVGLLTTMAIPSFNANINQGRASDEQNQLLAIYAAQTSYFNSNGRYCVGNGATCDNGKDCTTSVGVNNLGTCLGIAIITNNNDYGCTSVAGDGGFTCDATNARAPFTLRLVNTTPNLTGVYSAPAPRNPRCITLPATNCPN